MSKKLFVGNLPFEVNDADLVKVFSVVGKVASAHVVTNKHSNRSKGFGFVEMETEELAKEAVSQFEGATLNERAITVQIATPKEAPTVTKKPEFKKATPATPTTTTEPTIESTPAEPAANS